VDEPTCIDELRDRCYRLVLREEWWHHRFAERDLSVDEREVNSGS
jgi:hypothetical protein